MAGPKGSDTPVPGFGSLDPASREARRHRELFKELRANEGAFRRRRQDLAGKYGGWWVAFYGSGKQHLVAETEAELVAMMDREGLKAGTEFVARLPMPEFR